MTNWAILPAAGIGRRMSSTIPKQYLPLSGKPVIQYSLERLCKLSSIAGIVVVLHPEDSQFAELPVIDKRIETTCGGQERQESVLGGINHLSDRARDDDWVLVHDAARPCVLPKDIEALLGVVASHAIGGLLAAPLDNTLKEADESGHVKLTLDRRKYWNALTPQVFRYGLLKRALHGVIDEGIEVTDEASALEAAGHSPLLVPGDTNNIKITRESDLVLAESILDWQESCT